MSFLIFFVIACMVPAIFSTMLGYTLIALVLTLLPAWGAEVLFLIQLALWTVYALPAFVIASICWYFFGESQLFISPTTYTFFWQAGIMWYPVFAVPLVVWEFWKTFF